MYPSIMTQLWILLLLQLLSFHSISALNICKSTKVIRNFKISATETSAQTIPLKVKVADKLISSIFSIKPLFNIATQKARKSMMNQGMQIGVDWNSNVASIESKMLELKDEYNRLIIPSLDYPDYYLKPFHAYEDGNLSWQAAMEVESAALTVHAHIFTPPDKQQRELRFDGDFTLRDNFHKKMLEILQEQSNKFNPRCILDLGCSTGLSTLKLHSTFPTAKITGLDLSPYFLAGIILYYIIYRYNDIF